MMPLTYVELFAGAGGLSRGLEMAGWECVAHAEWDAHARAVLRRHWPDTPLFGDVSTLTGQMIAEASGGHPVTMLTGGSPCQDLSIAGKRAGMTEDSGTRSSLYFEQVRLWHELNAISPCPYLLWENVLGAFSSNNGRDFAAVLSALVGTPVAVPEDGWKGGGGVVSGCTGVAAWRVLDCQFFGPPQRRRRVFVLGVRAGGADPAEVLSLLDRLSGHPESGAEAGQNATPDVGASVASGGGDDGSAAFDSINVTSRANRTRVEPGRPSPTLHAGGMSALTPWDSQSKRLYASTGIYPSLMASGRSTPMISGVSPIDTRNATRTTDADAQNRVVMTVDKQTGNAETGSISPTLKTDLAHDMGPVIMRQREGKAGGGKGPLVSDKSLSLTGHNDQTVFAICTDQTNSNGLGVREGVSHTLDGANGQAVFTKQSHGEYADKGVASTISQRDYKDATDLVVTVRPRRLMPIECERLMGWPDRWTERGIDEQGRDYALSDSARYKLCGNGVASPVAAWIGWRLRVTLEGHA